MKIKKFHIVSDRMQTLQNKYNRASISFVIGMKESTTNIKLEDSRFREETMARQFEEETHIIKCDAEETMIIRCRLAGTLFKASDILPLDLLKLRKGPDKNDKKTTSAE